MMDKSTLQQKLNQPYTTDNWREIVQYVFPNVQIFNPPQVIPVDNDKVETFRQLGNVTLQDGKTLALFELKLKSNVNILRNRVELNNIVSQYIDQERTHGVLSIFEQGTDDYRFTFSAKATEFDEESGDFQTQKTDTKRYTYVLGRNESCKTPAARFADLADKKAHTNIQSIQDAFSVEKLSKEFFKEYKVHYLRMVDYLLATDAYKRGTFHGDEKAVRDFVKLLMGRLVFIQFVQKKRWMGVPAEIAGWHDGPVNFLYQSFSDFEYKETFYSAFLEPLFYDTLNTPNRPGDLFAVTGNKVPYLNGGLFEDGETDTSLINFPENYFADLLEFFDRYNFTIDENDPNEHEVGIDPEMLGHIFENLLEDNKDKGAFYTPKEIVHYMCQESLKEYLKTQLEYKGVWPSASHQATEMEQSLEAFVKRKEAAGIIDHDGILAQALRDVKICDPAIGSGAFPMGLLNEIFRCMFVLYHASPDTVGEIWGMETWQPETVKKNIIQNSIYGVDIERGAVDIARLRFWLSLIVDEPEPHALPNLDYKIVVGNSLVSKLDDDVIDINWKVKVGAQANAFGIANVERRRLLLQAISGKQKVYFDPTCDKENIGHEIRDLKLDLLINQLEEMINTQGMESKPTGTGKAITQQTERYLQTLGWKQSITKLEAIKKDQDAHLHFFDWKLDFPEVMNEQVTEKLGFDIVIGNPPYGAELKKDEKQFIKSKYTTSQTIPGIQKGSIDTFTLFIELGHTLTIKSGNLHFIVPISVTSSDSMTGVHNLIESDCSEIRVSSYAVRPQPVFENAVVNTSILYFKRDGTQCKMIMSTKMYRKNKAFDLENLVNNLSFIDIKDFKLQGRYPKISHITEINILTKLKKIDEKIGKLQKASGDKIYYRTTGGRYYKVITNYSTGSTQEKYLIFEPNISISIGAILSSSLFFWYYQIYSDNLHIKLYEIESFPIPIQQLNENAINIINQVYTLYLTDIESNANVRNTLKYANIDTFKEYKIGKSKKLIDRIDDIIGPLYGLNQEEIDFIKNYEIEFRLQDE